MKKTALFILIVLLWLLIPSVTFGVDQTGEPNNSEYSHWFYFPIIYSSPETDLAGGIYSIYYFNPEASASGIEPDQLELILIGTQKGQTMLVAGLNKYLANQSQKLLLNASCSNYASDFFGIGPDTATKNKENYSYVDTVLEGSYLWNVGKSIFLGPTFFYTNNTVTARKSGGIMDKGNIIGWKGINAVGGGLHLLWDQYDRLEQAGTVFEVKGISFSEGLGSDEDFSITKLDYRNFFKLAKNHILGVQALLLTSSGDVPFQFMPVLGGEGIMRGYLTGRYRDLNSFAFQGEYRYPIHERFSGVVFGSCGKIGSSISDLSSTSLRTTYGAGLRYMIDPEQKMNLRLDIAVSPDETELYFNFGEAF